MKEHVYFDRELINSTLAQIDEGILTKVISGQSTSDSKQEDGGTETTSEANGKMSILVATGGASYKETEVDKFSTVYSKNNSELMESALDDYSLDVLLNRLTDSDLLRTETDSLEEGDIFLSTDKFEVFNFEQLKKSVKKEHLDKLLPSPSEELEKAYSTLKSLNKNKQSQKTNASAIKELNAYIEETDPSIVFGKTYDFANYMADLFPDTTLFRMNNLLAFCNSNSLRINPPLMAFLSQTSRKITILGIATTRKESELAPTDGSQLETDEIISTGPAIFTDILLSSFNIAQIGNIFVRPIAIYFE